ncbi:hypothetical protein [Chitinophaga nivalis]|uniref:TonB C-terminal domain-containing protein n=1 Tax=Chitinophaga nivalis TaxID=2991709 RepID=A0ABT3IP31_9BACT|nr:hypothetical protein [Chitinophaga nivalis]MCW3464582.1 hypothetical protein [Chitinophaga nivalis]MCW3485727.1 hypothetical protein [Chitinophaga nivalis]
MRSKCSKTTLLILLLVFLGWNSYAQQSMANNGAYQQLSRFLDTIMTPSKGNSESLAFTIKAAIGVNGEITQLDFSTNVAGTLKPRLSALTGLPIKWAKLTGKNGKYIVIIPVYYIVEHASGIVRLNSKTEFTNGFYFDDGDLFDNKFLANYFFLKPIYIQRYL